MDYTTKEQNLYDEIRKLMDGNQASYDNVYTLSVDYVYGLALNLLEAAGEVAQNDVDTIINRVYSFIYYNINTLNEPQGFYGWAGQITTNETVDYLRQAGRFSMDKAVSSEEAAEPQITEYFSQDHEQIVSGDVLVNMEKQRLLTEYITSLSVYERVIVQYYFYEGMPVSGIAANLGCPESAVKKQISEIKKQVSLICGDESKNVTMYDMAALPILWFLFKSSFSGIPVAELADGIVVGGAAAAQATAGAGSAATGQEASGAGTLEAGQGANGAGTLEAGQGTSGAGTLEADQGATASQGATAGQGAAATGAATGLSTGVKIGIGIAALLVVGGGAAAIMHFTSANKNEATEQVSEEVLEPTEDETVEEPSTEEITEAPTEEATEEVNIAEDSIAAYEDFMAGSLTAVVDDMHVDDAYDSTVSYGFTQGETISLGDIDGRFGMCVAGQDYEAYSDIYDDYEITERRYGYIDAGNDGVQELVVNVIGMLNDSEGGDVTVVIKYREDGLHITYVGYSLYRVGTSVDSRGVVSNSGSGGYSSNYNERGVLDADGVYHNLYTMEFQGDPINIPLDDSFKTASDTMKSEFGDDYFPGVYIETYEIEGNTYYVAEDDEDYLGTSQNTRYHELLESTTGLSFTAQDEIDGMVENLQNTYVPNGVPGDTDAASIDWKSY